MRTARDLAEAVGSPSLSESVIENIEAGRKPDLPVSQLLNIAFALGVPPVYLLVPIERLGQPLDLPNLSPPLAGMDPLEFDAWVTGSSTGAFRPPTAAEQASRAELDALRELDAARRESNRLQASLEIVADGAARGELPVPGQEWAPTRLRLEQLDAQIQQLEGYLRSAGWEL